jgi:hypothetical protein
LGSCQHPEASSERIAHAYAIEKLSDAYLVLAFDGGEKKRTFRRKE